MELIPVFRRKIAPIVPAKLMQDTELVTQEIEQDGRKRLVPVLKFIDHAKDLVGLTYRDFNIQELAAAGKIENLRPAALLSHGALAAYDHLESQQQVLIDVMDQDIVTREFDNIPEPQSEPQSEPESK